MTQYDFRFSVLLKSLSLKNPKAQMYQNEERISFMTFSMWLSEMASQF